MIQSGYLDSEKTQIALENDAMIMKAIVAPLQGVSAVGYAIPTIFGFSDGGFHPGAAIEQGAKIVSNVADVLSMKSSLSGVVGSYKRRLQDWQLQARLAQDDITQIQHQIVAAQYQQDMAQQAIDVLEQEIKQKKDIADFYVKKFTKVELYEWYIGQVSALYFQAYGLAHDMALQAQNAWNYETIGLQGNAGARQFIKPSYWNGLYDGLLAGTSLQLDLERMEKSFMDLNQRRFEIEKTISLAQHDPQALANLKSGNSASFDLTERDFDFDFPGHYCRKIKTVSVSLPVVVGPYQNVHATLTQLTNKTIISDDSDGLKAAEYLLGADGGAQTSSLVSDLRPSQQIAISQTVDDAGLFMLNFNDERYLPFEGTGAISSWQFDLPSADNAFDLSNLADVIIKVKYTALSGNSTFYNGIHTARGDFNGYASTSLAAQYPQDWQTLITSNTASF